MNEFAHHEAQRFAEPAGIQVPTERMPAFAASWEMARPIAEALARIDYNDVVPAATFRAPRSNR